MSLTADDRATAYHEAGHAVMAMTLGREIQKISIQPNTLRMGHCEIKKGKSRASVDAVEAEILILLGGPAAEARHMGRYGWEAAARDLRDVRSLTQMRATNKRQIERLERRMLDKTEHLLGQPGVWDAVERIAEELSSRTVISGRAARHIFDLAIARSQDRE